MFCAAIPVTAAVGAKLDAKQKSEARETQAGGEDLREKPIKVITAGVIVLLLVGSVTYHTHFNSLI
jgi:hypothetical protein